MMKNVFKRLIRWACKEELDEMHKKLGEMYENNDKLIRSGKELAQYGREVQEVILSMFKTK